MKIRDKKIEAMKTICFDLDFKSFIFFLRSSLCKKQETNENFYKRIIEEIKGYQISPNVIVESGQNL